MNMARSGVESTEIEGIVEDFDRLDKLHETIQELRRQIPVLLTETLTLEQAQRAYTTDTRLSVGSDNVELASSLDELLALSNTFLLAVTASTRAGTLLTTALTPTTDARNNNNNNNNNATSEISPSGAPRVDSKVIVIPSNNFSSITVEWETEFFPLGDIGTGNRAQLIGYSELDIDPKSSKICHHRLLQVQWNGQLQNDKRIGQSLATLRRSVQLIQQSPLAQFVASGVVTNLFDQVRNEVVKQLSPASDTSPNMVVAPLFIKTNSLLDAPSGLCAVDDFDHERRPPLFGNVTGAIPIPGSSTWKSYAEATKTIRTFVEDTLPMLSKSQSMLPSSLFTSDACLITLDGSTLITEPARLVNFYKSLAAWRKRALVQWKLERVKMLEWRKAPKIQVDYCAQSSYQLPGTGVSASIKGTDTYLLRPPKSGSVHTNSPSVQIQEIRQTKLSIGDLVQSSQEGATFFRRLAAAIDASRMGDDSYESLWNDFLRRVSGDVAPTAVPNNKDSGYVNAQVSDMVAAKVYRIMDSLLISCPDLVNTSMPSHVPPCYEYMLDDIQLLGYLGETLIRGRSTYERVFSLSIASMKATLRTGQLTSVKAPDVRIMLNERRNIELSLKLNFKAMPLINLPVIDASRLLRDGGVPMQIEIVSEYIIDPTSGMITQQRLLESRVNGQLTPGDIISRWFKGQRASQTQTQTDNGEALMRGLYETVNWVRSLTDTSTDKAM